VIEFVRRYCELRRDRHLSKEQLVLRAQLAEEFERIWGRLKGSWEEFARRPAPTRYWPPSARG
jgi:hypothetical protein